MFRKIHSNRDPRDTVYSELKKEFSPYVHKAGNGLKSATDRYPKFIFWFMVINLSFSAVLSFTVLRHKEVEKPGPKTAAASSPLSNGFSQVIQAAENIRELVALRKQIDSLSTKKKLSAQDSVKLEKVLDRFGQINHQINQKK